MRRLASTSILIIGICVAGYGCGDKSAQTTGPAAAAPTIAAPPPAPPPTLAAQHETALVEMGAQLRDDGLYVTIPGSALEIKKDEDLPPAATEALDRVADLAKERGELRVSITGYSDDRGKKASSERESLKRAELVRDYIVSRRHLEASRTEVKGAGSADPISSNASDQGRAENRRVVVRIMTADGKYQSRAALGVQANSPASNDSQR